MFTLLIYLSLDKTIFGCPKMLKMIRPTGSTNQMKQSIAVVFWRCLSTMESETNLVCNSCVIYLASEKIHS